MTKPEKPAKAPTKRTVATWTVYEQIEDATVHRHGAPAPIEGSHLVLIRRDPEVTARTGSEACWHIAETDLHADATSDRPPVLCASRNGTAHGLTEARPYALKATVERVK